MRRQRFRFNCTAGMYAAGESRLASSAWWSRGYCSNRRVSIPPQAEESSGMGHNKGSVGVWALRHQPLYSSGSYEHCSGLISTDPAADHSSTYQTRKYSAQR